MPAYVLGVCYEIRNSDYSVFGGCVNFPLSNDYGNDSVNPLFVPSFYGYPKTTWFWHLIQTLKPVLVVLKRLKYSLQVEQ